MTGRVAGLVLAAGAGRRYGSPKALVVDDAGTPWVAARVAALREGGCDPVLVVLGAAADEARELLPDGAAVVVAEEWAEGMGASLRAGLAAATRLEPPVDAVLIALVDTPGLTSTAVARVLGACPGASSALAQGTYEGRPGHPVLLGREHWDGIARVARGDRGARDYLAGRDVLAVEVGDVADSRDVDVPPTLVGMSRPQATDPHPALAGQSVYSPDTSRLHEPARRVVRAEVTSSPLDVQVHAAEVDDAAAGAVVTFAGVVRDHDRGRQVSGIEYVGHPSAGRVLAEVVEDVAGRFPVDAVAVSHRIGELGIGDVALVVAVSAAHRQEAFEAASVMVDEVKHRLPVWKHQRFTDGTDEWVACP
jgi:molybdopterin synthase catalytic subunit